MRQTLSLFLSTVLLVVAFGSVVYAADDDMAMTAEHPLVGSWVIDTTPEDPTDQTSLDVFTSDGAFIGHGGLGPDIGVWAPADERGADVTVLLPMVDPEAGFVGNMTVRTRLQVSEDGQSLTGTYTLEFPTGPDGTPIGPFPPGQFGPADVTGERITVDPKGEPVGPMP